ncbi:MAG: succinate dehydrogenase, hydrophobic membrane anchor protein [Alphaproteobacteria bacterium]
MAGKGTGHHRLHSATGLVTIIALPFVLCGLLSAIPARAEGFAAWVGSPFGAVSLFVFLCAGLWYCKLELDDVIMDYLDGGARKFALLANKIIEAVIFLIAVYLIYTFWRGA